MASLGKSGQDRTECACCVAVNERNIDVAQQRVFSLGPVSSQILKLSMAFVLKVCGGVWLTGSNSLFNSAACAKHWTRQTLRPACKSSLMDLHTDANHDASHVTLPDLHRDATHDASSRSAEARVILTRVLAGTGLSLSARGRETNSQHCPANQAALCSHTLLFSIHLIFLTSRLQCFLQTCMSIKSQLFPFPTHFNLPHLMFLHPKCTEKWSEGSLR